MSVTTHSATLLGLKPLKIEVEIDTIPGLPNFVLIGLPGQAVDEAKERITAALTNCGIKIKAKRVVVNLAPADIRKTSSAFELAIAVGLLALYGEVPTPAPDTIFFGELSLTGELKPIRGILPLVIAAKTMGFTRVILPQANATEASLIQDIEIIALDHLQSYIQAQKKHQPLAIVLPTSLEKLPTQPHSILITDVVGQPQAKRALEIAAAGGHNLHLVGPPGAGKSMLAKSLNSILPPVSESEILDLTALYSLAGKLPLSGIMNLRPFRSPHHTISHVGLVGGGTNLLPGEISLAHRGILFMDELPEFSRHTIETLRQPLEDHSITITRAHGTVQYPATFTLVAASNPCACGYWGSEEKACQCNAHELQRYSQKLSGPLLDRIDLYVWVKPVKIKQLSLPEVSNPAIITEIRDRVSRARERQLHRFINTSHQINAELSSKEVRQFCHLEDQAQQLLIKAGEKLQISARSYYKLIKVAQTIADLDGSDQIKTAHIAEALQYRRESVHAKN